MLSEPITQSDIDNGTVFKMGDGRKRRITGAADKASYYRWISGDCPGDRLYYGDHGDCWLGNEKTHLISREPNMAQQIQVKDERKATSEADRRFSYESLPEWSVFEISTGAVFIKTELRGGVTPAIGLRDSHTCRPWYAHPPYDNWKCTPRPDLKLTLLLENA